MATDISTVKSGFVRNGEIPSAKGPAQGGGGIDFAEIIRNNGSRLDSGLNTLSDRAGITGVGERPDNPPAAAERSQDRASDSSDNSGSRADGDERPDRPSDRDLSSQPERPDDYGNDRAQDGRPEIRQDARENSQQAENNGETANRDDGPGDSSGNDDASAKETGAAKTDDTADGETGEQAAATGEGEKQDGGGNKGEAAPAAASTAGQMLNTLLANAGGAAVPGQAGVQAQENTADGRGKVNAVEGLNTAIASVGKQTGGGDANNGQSGANSGNTQTQAKTPNLGNGQGPAQAQTGASVETQTAAEAQARDTTKAADQAARISKLVGNGNKVDVSVTVTDEKSTLISRPTASLVSNSVVTADTGAPSLRSQQTQGNNNANAATQAQQVAGQVQQTVQQVAAGQAQSANAVAVDAKAAVQVSLPAGGSQATVSGTGETPVAAAPGSTTAAQQAQQNASTQAASSRFTTANPALTDQVSVQISKAINAGNDRISIQLKPAEMGRIDVQIEIGQDGRVIAVVSADNKGTLDLLQKDARELQQALQQAGLQVDNDSLSFNLREQGDGQGLAGKSQGGGEQGIGDSQASDLSLEEELAGLDRDIITDSRIDVRA